MAKSVAVSGVEHLAGGLHPDDGVGIFGREFGRIENSLLVLGALMWRLGAVLAVTGEWPRHKWHHVIFANASSTFGVISMILAKLLMSKTLIRLSLRQHRANLPLTSVIRLAANSKAPRPPLVM